MTSNVNIRDVHTYLGGSIDSIVHFHHTLKNENHSILVANTHSHSCAKQIILDVTIDEEHNTLCSSLSDPFLLPDRCLSCVSSLSEIKTQVISGLENGCIAITSLTDDAISMEQLDLQHHFPISSISVDPYTGTKNIAYEDGMILRYYPDDHQSQFQPEYGCLSLQSLGNEQLLVTSTQTHYSACIYDRSNAFVSSISHPHPYQHFTTSSVNPLNDKEIVLGSSDGSIIGYDLRNSNQPIFSYQGHSASITDLHYYSSPYPSILSCSLDGSVVQRVHSGEGRVLCSDRGCLNSCVLDPIMGLVATGGQKGELTMVYPI